jgi:CRP-like cAMP-binding protein
MDAALPNSQNRLLAALPQSEYRRLAPYLQSVSLRAGHILYEAGQPIEAVYFPHRALISWVAVMADGAIAEIDWVGSGGMAGISAVLGEDCATNRAIVQIADGAERLEVNLLRQEFERGGELRRLLLRYIQTRLNIVAQISVCRSRHSIEKQLARWLLSARDCVQADELPLTQQAIADLLGVRRAGVTQAAITLQKAGTIRYTRGQIAIVNRARLEAAACECYRRIQHESERWWNVGQGS